MEHPTPTILRGFLLQTLSQDEVRSVVAHLLPGCARCSAEIASLRDTLSRQKDLAKKLPTIGPSYDAAFERALTATLNQASTSQARERNDILGDDEANLPPQANKLVALYKDLLRQSWALRHKDPAKMLQLARRAAVVADALSPKRYGVKKVADWQCRAWAELGNACQVAEEHQSAEDSFKISMELFEGSNKGDILRARIFDLRGSLSASRWEYKAACSDLDFAYELYLRAGDRHLASRTLIKKAHCLNGDLELSMRLIYQGLDWTDKRREPESFFCAMHILVLSLIESGYYRKAQAVLRSPWSQHTNYLGQIGRIDRHWFEGKILLGLGEYELAEQAFLGAKRSFEQAGLLYKAAKLSIDLESVWQHLGRKDEAKELSEEAEKVFRSLHVTPKPR